MLTSLGRETGPARRSLERVVPPASEPVTLTEVKSYLRIDIDAEDALLADLITSARERIEVTSGRSLITQNWVLALDRWPATRSWVDLPKPPLQQVNAVRVYDSKGSVTQWSPEAYFADLTAGPGRLILRAGNTWPMPGRPVRGIEIDYVAGYGSSASDVPGALRQAILVEIARAYEQRGEESLAGAPAWASLVEPYRVRSL